VALWDVSISPCVHQNHLIKVRFFQTDVSRYALHWLLSSEGREYIKRVASSTSGLYTLSLSKVKALPIPLSPLKEQRIIVEEVERRLSVVDKLEATVEENLKQADALRQSILKLAFSGELVPQDPDDEPASVLLERIRSEREAAKPKFRKGRKSNARPARGGQTEQGGLF
jgi:type I restriction enzyme S subunit